MGKATFSAEQISAMKSALDAYGLPMPQVCLFKGDATFSKNPIRKQKRLLQKILNHANFCFILMSQNSDTLC